MSNTILQRIYQRLLRESSESPGDTTGFAAFTDLQGSTGERDVTVYDINKLVASLKKLRGSSPEPEWSDEDIIDAIRPNVVGYIRINKASNLGHGNCYDSWEVQFAAGPRIGKLLYGLGFALTDNGKLTSDRASVSPGAYGRWKKEQGARKTTQEFDNVDEPKTKPTYDDCIVFDDETGPILNKAYLEAGWERATLTNLRKQHERVKKYMLDKLKSSDGNPLFSPEDVSTIESLIPYAGGEFFDSSYSAFSSKD